MIFPRIYVPRNDVIAQQYYDYLSNKVPGLEIIVLPPTILPDYVYTLNDKPGILSLGLRCKVDSAGNIGDLEGCPFVVPGGRFNEMYGWDSYFESLGLILDGHVDLAKSMAENFTYEINHYGMILNANRSYYLTRSQPPFFTDMCYLVYKNLPESTPDDNKEWLRIALSAAIKEYFEVWMSEPRYTPETGLSRYFDSGIGMPIETEEGHFDAIFFRKATEQNMRMDDFKSAYLSGTIKDEELDVYFVHDRSLRESGHDTTYRLDGCSAFLNPIDLNCLLYKYEYQIGEIIRDVYGDTFQASNGQIYNSAPWFQRAEFRRQKVNEYCWDEESGFFFDYNIDTRQRTNYKAATVVYALWCGLATIEQARRIVEGPLVLLEEPGGVASCTADSLEGTHGPNRQWDHPFGWAPHQILTWVGLTKYGFRDVAERLAYRWLHMILQTYVNHNGTIPEKFNVVHRSCHVFVEYGNVGTEFAYLSREGFGWTNSSFQVGLTYLSPEMLSNLRMGISPEEIYPPLFFGESDDELPQIVNPRAL